MKKIISTISLCLVMVFSLVACGKSENYKVTLCDYKNLTVTQAEIDEEVSVILEHYADDSGKILDGTVKEDDLIDISYIGKVDDVAFEGGSADNQQIKVGSSGYIEGFDDGLIGKEIGSTFDLEVTFPEDYHNEDLAGKDAIFVTTINHGVEITLPEYTDEWVESVSEEILGEIVTNREDFEHFIFEYLIITKLFSESELDSYDEDTFNLMVSDQTSYFEDYASSQGLDLATLLSLYGMSEETIKSEVKDSLKWQAIVFEIASLENLNADEEYEEALLKEAKDADYDSSEEYIKGEEIKDYYLEYSKAYSLYPKVIDLVMSSAKII